jgi:hypothetical protein
MNESLHTGRPTRLVCSHVGEEHLRRRARLIQDLMLIGVATTAIGSAYTGLKGITGGGGRVRIDGYPLTVEEWAFYRRELTKWIDQTL